MSRYRTTPVPTARVSSPVRMSACFTPLFGTYKMSLDRRRTSSDSNFITLLRSTSTSRCWPLASLRTMPARGTVTISPGIKAILFEVLPVSRISLRFTVIVVERGGGTDGASLAVADRAEEPAPACAEDLETAGAADDGKMGCDAAGVAAEPKATGVSAASSGLIGGGVEVSSEGSLSARVTITESLASPAMPPASARISSKVSWRSAWYTIGCMTAPTTVIGLLFFSLTATLNSG